jgi:OOP family OmpA-OmpF porin
VILFDRAKADIDPKSSLTIARLAEIIKSCPGTRVEVAGHTDNEGEPDRNQRLSDRRARAVVRSLEYAGVPADRLSAVGFGAERPVADNGTAKGMARNRRIEFRAYTD